MKKNKEFFIVGIDEAGRGPLAGPVCVGAVGTAAISNFQFPISKKIQNSNFTLLNPKLLNNIKDSKKLSAKKREEWFKKLRDNPEFECHHIFVGNEAIDKFGIRKAVIFGAEKVLEKFSRQPDLVLLDGSLYAPEKYKQETIIKGDEKIPLIAAGSIIAKVSRDRVMMNMHEKYPEYCFNEHKGYGTKKHFEKIIKHGFCEIHRKTFCGSVVSLAKNG